MVLHVKVVHKINGQAYQDNKVWTWWIYEGILQLTNPQKETCYLQALSLENRSELADTVQCMDLWKLAYLYNFGMDVLSQ